MNLDQTIERLIKLKEQGFGEVPVCIANDNTLVDLEEVGALVVPNKGKEKLIIVLE